MGRVQQLGAAVVLVVMCAKGQAEVPTAEAAPKGVDCPLTST